MTPSNTREKFKNEYFASTALQVEFGNFETYAAYRRAEEDGRVKIAKPGASAPSPAEFKC